MKLEFRCDVKAKNYVYTKTDTIASIQNLIQLGFQTKIFLFSVNYKRKFIFLAICNVSQLLIVVT